MKAWTHEKIFHDGDHFFGDLEKDIREARFSVWVEIYIFELDTFGRKFITFLREAAHRGVQVRLLVDGFGSSEWNEALAEHLQTSGIQVRIFHPVPTWISTLLAPWNFWRLVRKLNRRNHRKVVLIDQKVAYVGSFNITSTHLREFSGPQAWRDSGARVEGKGVAALQASFQKTWGRTQKGGGRLRGYFSNRELGRHPLVKLNTSWNQRRRYHKEVLHRVVHARHRVWITNPYFVPDLLFLKALRQAARSGLDVRILLPKKNDILLMKLANRASYSFLLRGGVRVFEYRPTTLHAKILLIDRWLTLGSSNRNHRSLVHDLEVDIVLVHASSLESIENQFLEDLRHSDEILLLHWAGRSWIYGWVEKIVMSFKNWL